MSFTTQPEVTGTLGVAASTHWLASPTAIGVALPDIKARMDAIGVAVVRSTPQDFAGVLQRDADRYGKVIRELGVKK